MAGWGLVSVQAISLRQTLSFYLKSQIESYFSAAVKEHDFYGWSIGLDHNQRIPWLNPSNSFAISAQLSPQ